MNNLFIIIYNYKNGFNISLFVSSSIERILLVFYYLLCIFYISVITFTVSNILSYENIILYIGSLLYYLPYLAISIIFVLFFVLMYLDYENDLAVKPRILPKHYGATAHNSNSNNKDITYLTFFIILYVASLLTFFFISLICDICVGLRNIMSYLARVFEDCCKFEIESLIKVGIILVLFVVIYKAICYSKKDLFERILDRKIMLFIAFYLTILAFFFLLLHNYLLVVFFISTACFIVFLLFMERFNEKIAFLFETYIFFLKYYPFATLYYTFYSFVFISILFISVGSLFSLPLMTFDLIFYLWNNLENTNMISVDFLENYQLLSANDHGAGEFINSFTPNVSGNGPPGGPPGGPGPIHSNIIIGSGLTDQNGVDILDHETRNSRMKRDMLRGRQKFHLDGIPFTLLDGENNVNRSFGERSLASLSGTPSDIVGGLFVVREGDRLHNIGNTLDFGYNLWNEMDENLKKAWKYAKDVNDVNAKEDYDFARRMLRKFRFSDILSDEDVAEVDTWSQRNSNRIAEIRPSNIISKSIIDEILNRKKK